MSIPTVGDVYTATRAVLGDTGQSGGQVYTNTILQPHFQGAYSELFQAMQIVQNPRVNQVAYFNVPINTGYLDPATAGITSLGEIVSISERGGITAWAVSNAVAGSGIATVTSAATTLNTGNTAILYGVGGVSDDINGSWTVTVNSTTSTQLNGSTATGTYTSGGVLSFSNEEFQEMSPAQILNWVDQSPTNAFIVYTWERDVIRFPPCSSVRQLQIIYALSGAAPTATTASTGIDDSLNFLKFRTAGLAAESRDMESRAQKYNFRACGPRWETDQIPGGFLGTLLSAGVRNLQRLSPAQRRSPPYGLNRNRNRSVW